MMRSWLRSRIAQTPALIALHFFVGFVFWYGIEKIFLAQELGIGPNGIAVIVTLYMVMVLILDVPASVIADRWGRKRMLIVAVLMFIAANVVLGISHNFTVYLVGTALWALFTVSYEGTYEAILYDSLKEQKREKNFQKIDAWSRLFFMLGITVSSIASGFLADQFGLRDVYFLSVIPLIAALLALVIIREPRLHSDDEAEDVIKRGYIAHLLHAFGSVWRSPKLRLVMFGTVILFFLQTPLYEFNQYIYIELFHTPTLVGIAGGIGGLVLAVGFLIAIKRTFRPSILLFIAGISVMAVALISSNLSLAFLAVALGTGALLENALQTQLQHSTTSRTRASVTSAVYFIGNVLIVPFVFLFGAVAEGQSIWSAYIINGGVILAMAVIYLVLARNKLAPIEAKQL